MLSKLGVETENSEEYIFYLRMRGSNFYFYTPHLRKDKSHGGFLIFQGV